MKTVKAKFQENILTKEEYRNSMLDFHKVLLQYQDFINPKEISKIEISSEGIFIVLPNGLRFMWDPVDTRTALTHLVNDGGYECKERELLFDLVSRSHTIFDIGANVGWFGLHFSQLVKKSGGEVFAFEPVKKTFHMLEKNRKLNNATNLNSFNNGFGEKTGTENFFVPQCSGSVAASMKPLFDGKSESVECKVCRLDDFTREQGIERIDFLKCDVEGAEILVLRGGLESLKKYRPVIFMEMLRKWAAKYDYHPNEIISLLKSMGYSCFSSENGVLTKMEVMSDQCMETNFYFFHDETHGALLKEYTRA